MSDESKRVMKHRNENFDQVGFLVEKGGRKLYRAIAAKDGIAIADMIRQAILARAGLSVLPYPADLEKLDDAPNPDMAYKAIRELQRKEVTSDTIRRVMRKLSAEPPEARYLAPIDEWDIPTLEEIARRITATITRRKDAEHPCQVRLSGGEVAALRRILANLQKETAADRIPFDEDSLTDNFLID